MGNIVSVTETKVIQCPHCTGTTKCKQYVIRERGDTRIAVCDFCGESQPALRQDGLKLFSFAATLISGRNCMIDDHPNGPTCRVCNGIGKIRI